MSTRPVPRERRLLRSVFWLRDVAPDVADRRYFRSSSPNAGLRRGTGSKVHPRQAGSDRAERSERLLRIAEQDPRLERFRSIERFQEFPTAAD